MKPQIVSKITLKGVAGKVDIEKLIAAPGKKMELMKVWGMARKAKPGESEYGSYVKFSGRFSAINSSTGEMFQSGNLILPAVAEGLLAGSLEGENVEQVEFGFLIGVVFNPDVATKYTFTVESLIEPSQDDPLIRLGNALGISAMPALAAPAAEPKPAPAKEEKPAKSGKK